MGGCWLICGGRSFGDYRLLEAIMRGTVEKHGTPGSVISGAASGADALGVRWAQQARVPTIRTFPANWGKYGTAAGPIRNQQMIDEGRPDLVVAFPGGRGTDDMVRRAIAAEVECIIVSKNGTARSIKFSGGEG